MSDRIAVMVAARSWRSARRRRVYGTPKEEYTEALLAAVPVSRIRGG